MVKELSLTQRENLELRNEEGRIERYRETLRKKKEKRLNEFYLNQEEIIFPLNERDILIAGLFLYWGEGSKAISKEVFLSNTHPSVINFFIKWLKVIFNIPKSKLRFRMHFYEDMDIQKEINFWAKALGVSKEQFTKPYIKKTSFLRINEKGGFGHGTCNAGIYDARLSEQILMAIKAISDKHFSKGV